MDLKLKKKKDQSALPQGKSSFEDRFASVHDAVQRKLSGHMTHDLDNPFRAIHVDVPHYWDTEGTVLSLLEQFVGGYVWACKHDESFAAYHGEVPGLQGIYDRIVAYKVAQADPEKDEEEFYGARFAAWCLVELAVALPSMWD
jgi:hypothetical protein